MGARVEEGGDAGQACRRSGGWAGGRACAVRVRAVSLLTLSPSARQCSTSRKLAGAAVRFTSARLAAYAAGASCRAGQDMYLRVLRFRF